MVTSEISYKIFNIALQPSTFCNLNCHYCYLPNKHLNNRMNSEICAKLSYDIYSAKRKINLIWHAGEPLTTGINHFEGLISQFKKNKYVSNVVQTNATLITDKWCDLFIKYSMHVGVSIDGPEWANTERVNRKGENTYLKTMEGIKKLIYHNIKFIVIAVVNSSNIDKASELYNFFCKLGCDWVGINIEENECANTREICDDVRVLKFWEELFDAWSKNPVIEIREISNTLYWFDDIKFDRKFNLVDYKIDLFPSIGFNGDIVLLSPELLGAKSKKYNDFVVGNVTDISIFEFESKIDEIDYVNDFSIGVTKCSLECEYFSFCKGGQASNKFFETGKLEVTETKYCRNSQQRPINAIINQLNLE